MSEQAYPSFTPPAAPQSDPKGFAIASLVLGILNLCSWFLPICGGPLSIVGIILGILGLKSSQRTLAIVGIVLSGIGLLATIVNAIVGAIMGFSNPDMFNQFFNN
ncbi:MAG: DUF4190 domain-containing protein [Anaerolineales bacterium]|nr:DUF4190 domain-containing protein [Anaerolineales bacterium]